VPVSAARKDTHDGAGRGMWRHRAAPRPAEVLSAIPMLIVKTGEFFAHRSNQWVFITGIIMVITIGELDVLTGPDISLSLFYLLPVTFVTWRGGKRAGFALSVLSTCVSVFADAGELQSRAAVGYWNVAITLGFYLILTGTMSEFSVLLEWVRTDYLTGLANA